MKTNVYFIYPKVCFSDEGGQQINSTCLGLKVSGINNWSLLHEHVPDILTLASF